MGNEESRGIGELTMTNSEKLRSKRELLDALNMICRFCEFLPDGWEIMICADNQEAKITLWDDNQEDISGNFEGDMLNVRDLVLHAREECGLPDLGENGSDHDHP